MSIKGFIIIISSLSIGFLASEISHYIDDKYWEQQGIALGEQFKNDTRNFCVEHYSDYLINQ